MNNEQLGIPMRSADDKEARQREAKATGKKTYPWDTRKEEDQMYGYYISFDPTGCEPVDRILRAIAYAGKGCHNTCYWGEHDFGESGVSLNELIQDAANDSAEEITNAE